jgi:signal transduction histidine kinase/serine phosphatase RsbU (regulator of sigma subunit)/DNA-binding response OmpR family regulator
MPPSAGRPRRSRRAEGEPQLTADLFVGGDAGRLMSRLDWSRTPIGPVETWPQSLRAAVRIVLSSRYPMLLLWGPQFTQLYNDAYSELIGNQHPSAMGADVRVTLEAGWDVLGPLIHDAMTTGEASWVPALQLLLERAGYREEAYFSVSHAPAKDDEGATVGVFTVCSEVTEQVVGERRLRLLRDLSLRAGGSRTVEQTCQDLTEAVGGHAVDVPFAAVYLREGASLVRAAAIGDGAASLLPLRVGPADDDPFGLLPAATGGAAHRVDAVDRWGRVPSGPWSDPVQTAVLSPLPSADPEQPLGVLLIGLSASRALDENYASFVDLLTQQVALALRNARAHEDARARAEALAELDRVKTSFFTNVSHEFRTPLTLMLAPLSDALDDVAQPLPSEQRQRVETARRNAVRMTKLVDNLLTFSSIEAGRARVTRQPVDLAALTADLASLFRSAVERVGLRFDVDCRPLARLVAVDVGAWEKVVVNLLSNALKFTFVGGIVVSLESDDASVRLTVRDTGIGIDAQEQQRLFDRFHRVQGVRSRSHEGTGIGLSLVQELVQLHGGSVAVSSERGAGTAFVVTLPWSVLEVPDDVRPAQWDASSATAAALEEVSSWLGTGSEERPADSPGGSADGDDLADLRVLVADDNADMRDYLLRLLRAQGWQVEGVADGQAALDACERSRYDVLLSDVMMPRLDGFGLVRTLRSRPDTVALPVVLLSARAGAEASVEGLDTGADDYVVKPFVAADLVARLRSAVRLARLRTAHEEHLSALADTASVIASARALEDAVGTVAEQARALLRADCAAVVLTGAHDGAPVTFEAVAEAATSELAAPTAGSGEAGSVDAGWVDAGWVDAGWVDAGWVDHGSIDGVVVGSGAHPGPPAARPQPTSLSVPLVGRLGRRLGTLTVRARHRLGRGDELLLQPVASMLAALAEAAWRLQRQHEVALTLQRSLLPERLPDVPGLVLAARYLPASDDVEVGGDWYDATVLPDGRVALSVGDVEGHGVHAATVMGQLRTAVRAGVLEGLGPGEVVQQLELLVDRFSTSCTATLFLGYLDPVTGRLDWVNAGHPPPLLVPAGRSARWLEDETCPPVGAAFGSRPRVRSTVLGRRAQLLLYTDGLVERRSSQLDVGLDWLLRDAGAALRTTDGADETVDALLARMPAPDAGSDDTAVLLVRLLPEATATAEGRWQPLDVEFSYAATPRAAAAMRVDLRDNLRRAGVDDETAFEVVIGASEAVNNAVEHAQAPVRPQVEVALTVAADALHVTVQDFGSWRERPPALDRGRGSTLMAAVADVRVTPTATGTTVVLERRAGRPR